MIREEDFILPNQEIVLNEVSEFNTFLEKKFKSSPSSPKRDIPNPPSFVDDEPEISAKDHEKGRTTVNQSTSSSSSSDSSPLIDESIEMFLNSLSGDIYKDLLEEKEKSIDELKSQNHFSMLHTYSRLRIALRVTNSQIMRTEQKVELLERRISKERKKSVTLSRRLNYHENEIRSRYFRAKNENQLISGVEEERVVSPLNLYSKKRKKRRHRRVTYQQAANPFFRDEFLESPKKRKSVSYNNKKYFSENRRGRRKTTNQLPLQQHCPRRMFINTSRSTEQRFRKKSSSKHQIPLPISTEELMRKTQGDEAYEQYRKNEKERKEIRVLKDEIESIRRHQRHMEEKNEVILNEYDAEKRELVSKLENIQRQLEKYDMEILELEKNRLYQESFLSLEKEVYEL